MCASNRENNMFLGTILHYITVFYDALRRSYSFDPNQPKLDTIQNKMFASVVSLLDLKRVSVFQWNRNKPKQKLIFYQ